MTDLIMLIVTVVLCLSKLILFAALTVLAWVLIKKYSPETAESVKSTINKYKKES